MALQVTIKPVAQTRFLVRKRRFATRTIEEVVQVLERLSEESHTGPVTVHLGQGGIRSTQVEDQSELPGM